MRIKEEIPISIPSLRSGLGRVPYSGGDEKREIP